MLNGIDVSNWQPGSVPSQVKADFCIIKATGGTGFVNPVARHQMAVSPDRNGLYHFAGDGYPWTTPDTEAAHFLSQWTKLAESATIPVLDWESPAPVSDVAWAERWIRIVKDATGKTPLLYCNKSVAETYNWTKVRELGVKLWLAWYGSDQQITGYRPPSDRPFGVLGWSPVAIHQYSQHGRLPGYDGDLDLNIAYEDLWVTTQPLLIPDVEGVYEP